MQFVAAKWPVPYLFRWGLSGLQVDPSPAQRPALVPAAAGKKPSSSVISTHYRCSQFIHDHNHFFLLIIDRITIQGNDRSIAHVKTVGLQDSNAAA